MKLKKIPTIIFLATLLPSLSPVLAAPGFQEIASKGDRNLRIIFRVYEKYPFMPAKKEYFQNIQDSWIKKKVSYQNSSHKDRNEKFSEFYEAYRTTNDVLRDICIDMGNFSDTILDDFAQKLVEIESKRINVKREKFYNRFIVSRNEFSRAEKSFKRSLYYYSANLYDHGIELMISIYRDQGWAFPGKVNPVPRPMPTLSDARPLQDSPVIFMRKWEKTTLVKPVFVV